MSVKKRIVRWILNILSALALVLFTVIIAFWIRGQFKADWFQWHKPTRRRTPGAQATWWLENPASISHGRPFTSSARDTQRNTRNG
ncbi:MAG TPA: hypothetical protein VGP99_02910 [Tepidisphaeraceae bacterium]|nr:hypothetical protein [Tepidisphaeraceae bacterium]